MIRYFDPEGEHAITEAEAIRRQREAGRRHAYEYESDEAALEDFIALHWARRNVMDEDLKDPCPICEAAIGQPCRDNGEKWGGIHVGRMTGGAPLYIQHTGEYTEAGEGIFRTVESGVDALMANDAYIDELLAEMEAYFEANANE